MHVPEWVCVFACYLKGLPCALTLAQWPGRGECFVHPSQEIFSLNPSWVLGVGDQEVRRSNELRHSGPHFSSLLPMLIRASQVALVVKNWGTNAGRYKRCWFDPWVRKTPWRRAWQPTPVFLPGESHGQGSLVGYSPPWGCKESDVTEATQHTAHTPMLIKRQPQFSRSESEGEAILLCSPSEGIEEEEIGLVFDFDSALAPSTAPQIPGPSHDQFSGGKTHLEAPGRGRVSIKGRRAVSLENSLQGPGAVFREP